MIRTRLCLALLLAIAGETSAVLAATIRAPSAEAHARLFDARGTDDTRSTALSMALTAAWDASGCSTSSVLADVIAAGLARESQYAEFRTKYEGAATAACTRSTTASQSTQEPSTDAVGVLLAEVLDNVGRSRQTVGAEAATHPSVAALRSDQGNRKSTGDDAKTKDDAAPAGNSGELDELIKALQQQDTDIRALLVFHENMTNPDSKADAIVKNLCQLDVNDKPLNLARCSNQVYQEIGRRYQTIVSNTKTAEEVATKNKDKRVAGMKSLALDLQPRVEYAAALEASTRSANYGLYAGPSWNLQDDGKWKNGSEFLLRFNTEVFNIQGNQACLGAPKSWTRSGWCRGYTDISFVTPGPFPKESSNLTALPVNPFDQEGQLRVRAGIINHWNPWVGLEYGIGATSPIQDSNPFSRVEPQARLGLHFQTLYSDGVVGELSFGYLHDRSRTLLVDLDPGMNSSPVGDGDDPVVNASNDYVAKDYFDRAYLEGTVLFPRAEILGGWRLAGRLGIDAPLNGNSKADVRASVLIYYPLSNWLDTFKPVQSKPKP